MTDTCGQQDFRNDATLRDEFNPTSSESDITQTGLPLTISASMAWLPIALGLPIALNPRLSIAAVSVGPSQIITPLRADGHAMGTNRPERDPLIAHFFPTIDLKRMPMSLCPSRNIGNEKASDIEDHPTLSKRNDALVTPSEDASSFTMPSLHTPIILDEICDNTLLCSGSSSPASSACLCIGTDESTMCK